MKQLSLVSFAVFAIALAVAYVLYSFTHKVGDWIKFRKNQPVTEKVLTVEIDKSGVE